MWHLGLAPFYVQVSWNKFNLYSHMNGIVPHVPGGVAFLEWRVVYCNGIHYHKVYHHNKELWIQQCCYSGEIISMATM